MIIAVYVACLLTKNCARYFSNTGYVSLKKQKKKTYEFKKKNKSDSNRLFYVRRLQYMFWIY